MHRLSLFLLILIFLVFVPAQARADGWYFGGKLVYFEMDIPGIDDPDNSGLVLSYDWDFNYGMLGIEGEFTSTFEDGDLGAQKVELDTAGLYGVYRTRGLNRKGIGPYFKFKAGAAYTDLTIGNTSQDDTSFSAGLGFGLNMRVVSFELEYTIIADDIDMVNLYVRF